MGLFGIFAMTVGLGAMAKDRISDRYQDGVQREKALQEDKLWFLSDGGKIRSTRTGKYALEHKDPTGFTYLVDMKTKNIIDNLTEHDNNKRTEAARQSAIRNNKVFYQTYEFNTDNTKRSKEIYLSVKLPGYYKRDISKNDVFYYPVKVVETGLSYYSYSEDLEGLIERKTRKCEEPDYSGPKYYEDGTLYTQKTAAIKRNEKDRLQAIKWGNKFYCSGIGYYHDDICRIYRHVDTEEEYIGKLYGRIDGGIEILRGKDEYGNMAYGLKKAKKINYDFNKTSYRDYYIPVEGAKLYTIKGKELQQPWMNAEREKQIETEYYKEKTRYIYEKKLSDLHLDRATKTISEEEFQKRSKELYDEWYR